MREIFAIQTFEECNVDQKMRCDSMTRDLEAAKEDLRIARSEAQDYRLLEVQAAKRLVRIQDEEWGRKGKEGAAV